MNLQSSWPVEAESDFSIHNLPFGIFSAENLSPRPGIALGNHIVHLAAFVRSGLMGEEVWPYKETLLAPVLNPLIEAGPEAWRILRNRVQMVFSVGNEALWAQYVPDRLMIEMSEATMFLPIHIGDYTDFYSSEYHAANVGAMFRDPANPLLPNWKHIPVGYHGRSSSIVVSGTNFHRPHGQIKPPTAEVPFFGPSKQMDLELETAFVISKNTAMGSQIGVDEAEDSIFGMVLFNDWSARDIQAWEYVPLGPFLGKNFCSSASPWVVTMDALKPFRTKMPDVQEPPVLDYLKQKDRWTYDINLEANLILNDGQSATISKTNQRFLYWSMNQQLAHHTVNGCPMRVGDLLASGTISGPTTDSLGCLLEITKRGQQPIVFPNGVSRNFLEDGDSIEIKGWAEKDGIRVGFGKVIGTVLPPIVL